MNEEENSQQLIPLIEVEEIWRLLLYDGVLGTLELLQLGVGGGSVELLQLDVEGGGVVLPQLGDGGGGVELLQFDVEVVVDSFLSRVQVLANKSICSWYLRGTDRYM
jgi:hypothetical protein